MRLCLLSFGEIQIGMFSSPYERSKRFLYNRKCGVSAVTAKIINVIICTEQRIKIRIATIILA